jgi:hypothetical protein
MFGGWFSHDVTSSRVVDSSEVSSCGGERQTEWQWAHVMEHAKRGGPLSSCGGAKGEESSMTRGTHHHIYQSCGTQRHVMQKTTLQNSRGT